MGAVQARRDEVGVAEEAGDVRVDRRPVDPLRRPRLGDPPAGEDRHLVGQGQGLVLVVGDEDGGRPDGGQGRLDVGPRRRPELRVERGERLVEQDDRRVDGQGPGEGDALLLAARELVRPAAVEPGEPDELEQLADEDARPRRARGRPKATLAATVRCGKSAPSWGT